MHYDFFPSCSIKEVTGFKCAGCGGQVAMYNLLNLNVIESIKSNFLVLAFLLYGVAFLIVRMFSDVMVKKYYGKESAIIWLITITCFTVIRNLL